MARSFPRIVERGVELLVIPIGNPWRGDDGAARAVGELLASQPGITVRPVLQLSPELAPELAAETLVVFVDADRRARHSRLEPLDEVPGALRGSPSTVGHEVSIEEVVTLARRLFDFSGAVWVCRVPAHRFRLQVGLSAATAREIEPAATAVRGLLARARPSAHRPHSAEDAPRAGATE